MVGKVELPQAEEHSVGGRGVSGVDARDEALDQRRVECEVRVPYLEDLPHVHVGEAPLKADYAVFEEVDFVLLEGIEGSVDHPGTWEIDSHPEEGKAAFGIHQPESLQDERSLNVGGVEEGGCCGIGPQDVVLRPIAYPCG
jgi:hypothetical protein